MISTNGSDTESTQVNVEEARDRIERAMDHLKHRELAAMEVDLQVAHTALGGTEEGLYEGFEEWDENDR